MGALSSRSPNTANKAVEKMRLPMLSAASLSQVERQLRTEIDLQIRYAKALEEEGLIIQKFKRDDLEIRIETRSELSDKIQVSIDQRETLRSTLEPQGNRTLTQIINERAPKIEKQKILKLATTLRSLVESNKIRSVQLGRLVQFTQTMVDGSIAILRSASHPVTRSYGRNRVTVERDAPKTRGGKQITEA